MDASFIPIEVVPGITPFGLDQLRRSYKSALSATAAIAAAPAVGTADETFPFMFLMPVSTPESAESATRIELVYMGCMVAVSGSPVLPAQQHEDTEQVMSATSGKSSSGGTPTSPITAQFYAPSSVLKWITYNAKGVKGTATDPAGHISIITVAIGDNTFTYGSAGMEGIVSNFFTEQQVDTLNVIELVPGKFWQNTEMKTKTLVPWTINMPPGFYPYFYTGGSGYSIGDSITVTGTGSCTMVVTGLFTGGAISGENITSNSLSAVSTTPISATGGTGSGAKFTVIHIT